MMFTRRQSLAALLPCAAQAQGQWSPPQIPEVAVQDQDGRAWRLRSELAGERPIVLGFMFTSCAATCPA